MRQTAMALAVASILAVPATAAAQAKEQFVPINSYWVGPYAPGVRWGLENLVIDEKRLKELGAVGFMQPLKMSCADHEGGGQVKFQQWDGRQWKVISDWIESDQRLVRPMIEASAAQYAKEKGITPRDCSMEK